MTEFERRLAEILRDARYDREVTEAAQLSDVMWLENALEEVALAPDRRHTWKARVGVLRSKVDHGLGHLHDVLRGPPTTGGERELMMFARRIREADRQISDIWVDIQAEELALALDCPALLSRGEPHPAHLKDLSRVLRAAEALCRALGGDPEGGPLERAAWLGDFARQSCDDPARMEAASQAASMEVALLRSTYAAQEQAFKSRLGKALVTLAQSQLAIGDVDRATATATEACDLLHPDQVPDEVLGLVAR